MVCCACTKCATPAPSVRHLHQVCDTCTKCAALVPSAYSLFVRCGGGMGGVFCLCEWGEGNQGLGRDVAVCFVSLGVVAALMCTPKEVHMLRGTQHAWCGGSAHVHPKGGAQEGPKEGPKEVHMLRGTQHSSCPACATHWTRGARLCCLTRPHPEVSGSACPIPAITAQRSVAPSMNTIGQPGRLPLQRPTSHRWPA
eukprot:365321-Chlamydomonas_euryale.AAC.23